MLYSADFLPRVWANQYTNMASVTSVRLLWLCPNLIFTCSFASMAEDDGLLLNLSSYSDGQEDLNQRKTDRKSKVKFP